MQFCAQNYVASSKCVNLDIRKLIICIVSYYCIRGESKHLKPHRWVQMSPCHWTLVLLGYIARKKSCLRRRSPTTLQPNLLVCPAESKSVAVWMPFIMYHLKRILKLNVHKWKTGFFHSSCTGMRRIGSVFETLSVCDLRPSQARLFVPLHSHLVNA